MFLIQDQHRLPLQSAVAGEGSGVWAIIEQWAPGDMLVLLVSAARARGIPRVIWMELASGASSLDQFIGGGNVLRGAAIVSTRLGRPAEEWRLDPLSEIRVGATEFSERDRRLMTVTQFTTTQGRKLSVPGGFTDRYARGRRVWHTSSPVVDVGQ